MTREEAKAWFKVLLKDEYAFNSADREAFAMAIKALEQEPCDNAVSRQAVIDIVDSYSDSQSNVEDVTQDIISDIVALPPVTPQPKAEQFAKWVAGEIFDDEWEYNKDAFAEIACRKLAKLGIVIRMGDEWELIESQESEDKE